MMPGSDRTTDGVRAISQTANAAALRTRLGHVCWIGGGSGSGKSTIARRIAAGQGLRVYSTDDAMSDHASASHAKTARS
jgi:adenylylsulfate kinase-like enzyme